jgi:hypothetical protein
VRESCRVLDWQYVLIESKLGFLVVVTAENLFNFCIWSILRKFIR